MIEVTVHIPALDKLISAIEAQKVSTPGTTASPKSEAPAEEKPKTLTAAQKKAAKAADVKAAKEKAAAEKVETEKDSPAPTHTVEELKKLAGQLIEASDVPTLRSALDAAGLPSTGAGSKVSDCDASFYDEIFTKITEALELAASI